jgi:glycosyltransferase involved in cell wall biosynthesis
LETHTWDLAWGLAQRGRKVIILSSRHPEGLEQEIIEGIHIKYLPRTRPAQYSSLFFHEMNKEILRLHSEEHFDIVHSQGFAGLTFHPPPGLPFVATLHGTLFSETPLYREIFKNFSLWEKISGIWRYRRRIMIIPLYRRFLKRLARIFVDSRFSYQETLRDCAGIEDKLRIAPLGIKTGSPPSLDSPAARERLGLPKQGGILFTLSRLEEMKGVDLVLEAIARIPLRNFLYLIGGEGRQKAQLEQKRDQLGLLHVRFLGKIPKEQLSDYFTAADLFVYPEISQPAFGLVSVESMFHGTPVLASDAGAIPEVVTPGVGWSFRRGDVQSLTENLQKLLPRLAELRNRSGELRRYVVEHFSLDRFLDQTLEIYQEVRGSR